MKLLVLIIFSLIVTTAAKAQFNSADSLILYKHDFRPINKKLYSPLHYNTILPATIDIYDNSILKIPEPVLTYNYNINNFNIYQSTPDNMYVIKPDSSIAFNMPVKKFLMQMAQ